MPPPQRHRGETKTAARQRWKATGRCQTCGRKMKGRGKECSTCRAKRNKALRAAGEVQVRFGGKR